ncbi:hypothetical protein VFPBJ_11616 [Purpureocillium lilacinum]|uniref:Uncharacterized protein n=1 Tax=Purpureocillium lilacinum TaxID=33203 RepID=A0A179F1G5_PURLI|nr:hypothetical protein VFPBJ_11616 [Purpureocillium lilacinum]
MKLTIAPFVASLAAADFCNGGARIAGRNEGRKNCVSNWNKIYADPGFDNEERDNKQLKDRRLWCSNVTLAIALHSASLTKSITYACCPRGAKKDDLIGLALLLEKLPVRPRGDGLELKFFILGQRIRQCCNGLGRVGLGLLSTGTYTSSGAPLQTLTLSNFPLPLTFYVFHFVMLVAAAQLVVNTELRRTQLPKVSQDVD